MKVMFLYCHDGQMVTGGMKYEDTLYKIWADNPDVETDRVWLNLPMRGKKRHLAWTRTLSQLHRLGGYDLVIFNSAQGDIFLPLARLLRLKGVKTAAVHHHFIHHDIKGWRRHHYKAWENGFLRSVDHIIIPSPYIDALCRDMFPGKNRHYWQIPFDTPAIPLGNRPEAGNLLFIGTIEPRKGLAYLLEAMTRLKKRGTDCSLTVIGKTLSAEYRDMLDRKISREGLRVRFTGYITKEEMDAIVSRSDIFAFPSLLEGYGMAICESMVNGLPVICFDNSAMPYTVKDGVNGLLVKDRDSAAMADAIARVITDRPLRDRLSKGAVETSRGFMTSARFIPMVNRDILSMK